MAVRILDGVNAFFDQLGSVHFLPLALAIGCHLLKLACTSRAWRNVLAAAYPEERVRWRSIYGAYLAGVGINAIIPARAGDAVRIVLAHRAIPTSTYTTVVSSTLVLSFFDFLAASLFLTWAVTLGLLPGLDVLSRLDSFDFAWILSRPLLFDLAIAGTIVVIGLVAVWVAGHVAEFRDRFAQAFRVLSPPTRYLGTVVPWQVADWSLRLLTIWFMLAAFGIPQTLQNTGLVQVSTSVSTLFPITPAGVGTEQAFLLYVLKGVAAASVLLAFSVGAKLTITITNVVAGFTAIALTLRTVRFRKALGPPPPEEATEG
jgi:glycosyltransferase 2 family protein